MNLKSDTIKVEKHIYLIRLNEQLKDFESNFNSIKEKVELKKFTDEKEVRQKFNKLKECMDRLSWKIHHLKESENVVDNLVMQSFDDSIDEINWRIDSIESAMEGKHLWDAGDDLKRGKNRLKNLIESNK